MSRSFLGGLEVLPEDGSSLEVIDAGDGRDAEETFLLAQQLLRDTRPGGTGEDNIEID